MPEHDVHPRHALDPELAALRDARAGNPMPHEVTAYRAAIVAGHVAMERGPEVGRVHETRMAGVPVRTFEPSDDQRLAAGGTDRTVVYVHGGGWVLGDLDYADEICRLLCAHLGAVVVALDYRLAPEHPFPAGLQDVEAAIDASASRWPGDVVVMGDSAGANLATVATRRLHATGNTRVDLQVLLYPVTDPDELPSRRDNVWPISADDMAWYYAQYLPQGLSDPLVEHPDVSPLRAEDLASLPRTHVVLAGHDPLHDEGLAYAHALEHAGVPVTVRENHHLPHGFLRFSALSAAVREARDALVDDLTNLMVRC